MSTPASIRRSRWRRRAGCRSIADQRGFPHGIVARAELHRPDVETTLAAHCRFPNVRGIRHIVNWHPDPAKTYRDEAGSPHRPRMAARLRPAETLQSLVRPATLSVADGGRRGACRGASATPRSSSIMPACRSIATPTALSLWRAGMRALAAQPNVWVKISGLGMVDWRWTEREHPPVRAGDDRDLRA